MNDQKQDSKNSIDYSIFLLQQLNPIRELHSKLFTLCQHSLQNQVFHINALTNEYIVKCMYKTYQIHSA